MKRSQSSPAFQQLTKHYGVLHVTPAHSLTGMCKSQSTSSLSTVPHAITPSLEQIPAIEMFYTPSYNYIVCNTTQNMIDKLHSVEDYALCLATPPDIVDEEPIENPLSQTKSYGTRRRERNANKSTNDTPDGVTVL